MKPGFAGKHDVMTGIRSQNGGPQMLAIGVVAWIGGRSRAIACHGERCSAVARLVRQRLHAVPDHGKQMVRGIRRITETRSA